MRRVHRAGEDDQTGAVAVLPWVARLAAALVRGERCALSELDQAERLAIRRAAVELGQARHPRGPRTGRRAA